MLSVRTHLEAQCAPSHYEQDEQLQTEMLDVPCWRTILYPMRAISHMKIDSQLDHRVPFGTQLNWEGPQPKDFAILHQNKEHKPFHTILQQDHNFRSYGRQLQFHHQVQLHASSTMNDDNCWQHLLTAPGIFPKNKNY